MSLKVNWNSRSKKQSELMKFQHREEHRDMLLGNVSWKFIVKQVASLALLLQGAMSVETPWANKSDDL